MPADVDGHGMDRNLPQGAQSDGQASAVSESKADQEPPQRATRRSANSGRTGSRAKARQGFWGRLRSIHKWLKEYEAEAGMIFAIVVSLFTTGRVATSPTSTSHGFVGYSDQALYLASALVVVSALLVVYLYLWRPHKRYFAKGEGGTSVYERLKAMDARLTTEILGKGPLPPSGQVSTKTTNEVVVLATAIAIARNIRATADKVETGIEKSVIALVVWSGFVLLIGFFIPEWIPPASYYDPTLAILLLLFVLGAGGAAISRVWPTYPFYGIAQWKKQVNAIFRMNEEELQSWLEDKARIGPYYPLF